MSTAKNCARCMVPTRATITAAFGYENVRYEIALCQQHADMFDRDMIGWLRLASEVAAAPPKIVPPPAPAPKPEPRPVDINRPIRFLIPQAPPREVILDEPAPPARVREVSPKALSYNLTTHAEQQMRARGITPMDVYRLIDDPAKSREPGRDGTHIYRKNGLKVVVNERQRSIITTARRDVEELSA